MSTLLEVEGLNAFYGGFQALYEAALTVDQGEIVAVVGANGAGKTTLLKSVVGLVTTKTGQILFDGRPIESERPERVAEAGVVLVPEGRRIFPSLTIEENLLMGAYVDREGNWDLDRVYDLFPVLGERRKASGMTLSGGQQQMLAIGRGLMANPRLLMLDEISLGLAPVVIRQLYGVVPTLREDGISLLLVEQDVRQALDSADRTYCLLGGRVAMEARSGEVEQADLVAAYFGIRD